MFGLRKVSAATSALLIPWVIRARISDSRSVRPSARPGQSSPLRCGARAGGSLMTISPAWTASSAATRSRAGSVLDRYPLHSLPAGALDQVGVEVPGVDDDPARSGLRDQDADLVVVGLRLREGVVQHDVDDVLDRLVGVDLGDDDPVPVAVEHAGRYPQHDVVVVDQRDGDRRRRGQATSRTVNPP